MARPAKSISTQSRHNTKDELRVRKEAEDALKGNTDKVTPPDHLNDSQRLVFASIVDELEASGILCNLDIYILSTCAIAIDRLTDIESMINDNPSQITNKDLMSAKDKYTKDLFRCCNELSLSPQSRSKIGSLTMQKEKEKQDPLIQVLAGGKFGT